jgi:hypothetical protein
MPITDVPVKVSDGAQKKGTVGRDMAMVHRVETSQSPVCAMECMVYTGSNTFFNMEMLKRYPSIVSYVVSGSSKDTFGAYKDLSMPVVKSRDKSSDITDMYVASASPSSLVAEDTDATARRGRTEPRDEGTPRKREGAAEGEAPRAKGGAYACMEV